jgi:hypothetical protein
MDGIQIGQCCRSVHFLHAVSWGNQVPRGTEVGSYVFHFADGTTQKMAIICGEDVDEWWQSPDQPQTYPRAKVIWKGANARGNKIQLFKSTWPNPKPELEIVSLDFRSSMTEAAPFLVAVTVE